MGFIARFYFICGIMDTMVGVLRGLGYSVIPMVASLVGACGLRLVWVATVFQVYTTPASLYISYPITWGITAMVHIGFFLFVRKRAYARVKSSGAAYLATEGEHPEIKK